MLHKPGRYTLYTPSPYGTTYCSQATNLYNMPDDECCTTLADAFEHKHS